MDPTACDKYELPETNLRMCSRSPNIRGHSTSSARSLEPQGLVQRHSLDKNNDDDSDSDDDDNDSSGVHEHKCARICLILMALIIILMVTHTATTEKPYVSLPTLPSWNNYA